jgi:hypothetical protein
VIATLSGPSWRSPLFCRFRPHAGLVTSGQTFVRRCQALWSGPDCRRRPAAPTRNGLALRGGAPTKIAPRCRMHWLCRVARRVGLAATRQTFVRWSQTVADAPPTVIGWGPGKRDRLRDQCRTSACRRRGEPVGPRSRGRPRGPDDRNGRPDDPNGRLGDPSGRHGHEFPAQKPERPGRPSARTSGH